MARKNSNGHGTIRKKRVKGKVYFEARYTDPVTHQQRSICSTTEAECSRRLLEIISKITTGNFVTPTKKTVGEWMTEWLSKKKDLEAGTYVSYESVNRLYITPQLGRAKLQDLRRSHCQEFIDGLSDKSAKYVHNIAGVLSEALQEACKRELINKNPAADLDLPKVIKKEPIAMESELQRRFVEEVNASRYRNIFLIALHTGARISEVLGLQWKNINMDTGEIWIAGQLERKRTKDSVREVKERTKTKKKRNMFVPAYVVAYLKDERKRQTEMRLKAGRSWQNDSDLVFTRDDGSPMPHRTIENAFVRIRNSLGHPEITLHTLRKTFVTNEERVGTDIKTISSMVGHSASGITLDVYTASTNEMKREAAQRKQRSYEASTQK